MEERRTLRTVRACNACRLRKVKCNGNQPCAQCSHLNVACAFRTTAERRRPPVRGRLISQLRSTQQGKSESKQRPIAIKARAPLESSPEHLEGHVLSARMPLDEVYFTGLIPSYEKFAYPVHPVVSSAEILESIQLMRESPGHAAFVYAFAAITVNLTEVSPPTLPDDVAARFNDLKARSLAAKHEAQGSRGGGGGLESPTDRTCAGSVRYIMTCIFLEMCAMACKQPERAFVCLQEAIASIHLLRIDRTDDPDGNTPQRAELARRQRMYWEAYIHERFMSIVSGLPSTMPPLRTGLPYTDPTIPVHIHEGFTRLIRLFLVPDNEFLSYWNTQDLPEAERPPMTAEYIKHKQTQLDDDEAQMAAMDTVNIDDKRTQVTLTSLQRADLNVTRAWQRVLVWQLAMTRCLLSSVPPASSHEAMSLVFPARRLGSQLRSLVAQLDPITTIGIHGSGMLQKLFEITNTIADVLAMVPDATSNQTVDDFVFLVRVLLSFDRIDIVQRDILRMKIQNMDNIFSSTQIEAKVFLG